MKKIGDNMKIVALDTHAVEQNELNFESRLKPYGEVISYSNTKQEDAISRIGDADIVLTNKVLMTKEVFENCPNLKFVAVLATGFNTIDLKEANKHGVLVSNVPQYSTDSVAQLTFALLLELCCAVGQHSLATRNGEWSKSKDFCFQTQKIIELSGKTFGIVGYGNIGRSVEKIAHAFGMKVLKWNRTPKADTVNLDYLLNNSDVVSLHLALDKDNEKMVDASFLSKMKQTAFLLNTSRGGLIDENALADFLNCERIAGAGVDVLSKEPPKDDNALLFAKNILVTPHIAWMSFEARKRLFEIVIQNVEMFINGKPQNIIKI